MGKDNIRGMQCVELIPGANHYIKHEEPDPNEANRQGEVKVYRLNPDGTKGELLRTEPAFPEGWDDPAKKLRAKEMVGDIDGQRSITVTINMDPGEIITIDVFKSFVSAYKKQMRIDNEWNVIKKEVRP